MTDTRAPLTADEIEKLREWATDEKTRAARYRLLNEPEFPSEVYLRRVILALDEMEALKREMDEACRRLAFTEGQERRASDDNARLRARLEAVEAERDRLRSRLAEVERERDELRDREEKRQRTGPHGPDGWVSDFQETLRSRYIEICDRLQECVQRHGFGLAGVRVDVLVVEEVDRLVAENAKLRDARAEPEA